MPESNEPFPPDICDPDRIRKLVAELYPELGEIAAAKTPEEKLFHLQKLRDRVTSGVSICPPEPEGIHGEMVDSAMLHETPPSRSPSVPAIRAQSNDARSRFWRAVRETRECFVDLFAHFMTRGQI